MDFWSNLVPAFARPKFQVSSLCKEKYGRNGLAVIGVSVDEGGADVVKPFAQQLGMNYTVVLADDKTTQTFGGIEAIPTTFIIDREGRIVTKHLGFTEKDEFEKELKPLLNL